MKKQHLREKSSISKSEYNLLEKLQKTNQTTFTTRQASNTTKWKPEKTRQTLSKLSKKKIIHRIKRGQYTTKTPAEEIEETAQKTIWPSYLSHWSALRKHNLTEQLPRTVFLTTTRKSGTTTIGEFKVKYIKVMPYRFFGYERIGETTVAEKEKALVESLMQPKYSGGIGETSKSLKEAWDAIDQEKLLEYALRMKNKTMVKRLGYLIEEKRLKTKAGLIKKLVSNTGSGYSLLDPQKPKKGPYNKKWGLMVNTEVEA